MNLSSTLGFSPRLPVSVYGTGSCYLSLEVFLEALRYTISLSEDSEYYRISPNLRDLPAGPIGRCFNELFRQLAVLSSLRHPITIIRVREY